MVSGRLITRHCSSAALLSAVLVGTVSTHAGGCSAHLYLTFDTGHMGVAPLIAEVLKRQKVLVTFFAANETTQTGDGTLGNDWAPWWKARAEEGHEFASHTYDHVYWRSDDRSVEPRFRVRPTFGAFANREFTWDAKKYCQQIAYANERLFDRTGKKPLPLWRAPGGRASPKLLQAVQACGFAHVGWSTTGFLGDELPSDKFSNEKLLSQSLKNIKSGDILVAHLGIWSRKDPWAPAVLEPLIVGLKARGFCFETLRNHPDYRAWIAKSESNAPGKP